MKYSEVVKVTSIAFSKNQALRQHLLEFFPNAQFNEKGIRFSEKELLQYLADAYGAIVGLDLMPEKTLKALPHLNVISKYGVGIDNIDLNAANRLQKNILWTAGVNKRSVAELTLTFMLGLVRQVFRTGFLLKGGTWDKNGGQQLTGKTIGIIGCGYIGEEVLKLLAPFNCNVLINDILDKTTVATHYGAKVVGFSYLLENSDLISLHLPLTDKTKHMFNSDTFLQMKKSAFLINTSRGNIVDQKDLKMALANKTIAGAALDVFEEEPPADKEFLSLNNLMVSPHIGGNSEEAVLAMGMAAIDNLINFFNKRKIS